MAFTGTIAQLPVGQDGINGIENLDRIRPDQLVDALNVSFAQGGITRDGGATKLNATALGGGATIIGAHDWWPDATSQRTIALASNGAAYRDTGAGTFATTLRSGQSWSASSIPVFVEGGKEGSASNKKLFIFPGSLNQVQVLSGDGVTLSDLGANKPVDWAASFPCCGANHLGRLWGAGNPNDPHRLYYSTISDMEDFRSAGAGTIAVSPGEGRGIITMASFKGLLMVWKYPRGIYLVDTTDPTPSNWIVRRISAAVGGASPRCWAPVDNDLVFMDATGGFHMLSAVQEYGDVAASSISERVYFTEWARRNLNLSKFSNVQAIYYPYRREAHFTAASVNSSTMDLRIIWDFNRNDGSGVIPRFRYNNFPPGPALLTYLDANSITRPACGDNAGFIRKLDQDTKSYDGAGYVSSFRTAALDADFGSQNQDPSGGTDQNVGGVRRKIGKFLELVIVPKGAFTLSVSVYWDDDLRSTLSYDMGGSGVALGTFVLDTNALAGGSIVREKHRLIGDGYRFSIEASISGAGEDFSVSKFYFYYKLGSMRVAP